MAVKTVTVISETCVRCGGATGPEVIPGDTVKLWLDQEAVPNFPEWVEGTIVTVEPQTVSSTAPKEYVVQYESGDLDDAAAELRDCDVLSVTCVGCCAIINDYLDLMAGINIPHVSLSYEWNEDRTAFTLSAFAWSTQIAGNPGEQVTVESYVFKDPDGVVIVGSGSTRVVTPDDLGTSGVYTVTITDSEGLANTAHVWVTPYPFQTWSVVKGVAFGEHALENDGGGGSVALGNYALQNATAGSGNVAVGNFALNAAEGAGENVAIGGSTAVNLVSGTINVVVGAGSFFNATVCSGNTVVGAGSLTNHTTGASNTVLGSAAGNTLTTGDVNVLLGVSANVSTAADSNSIVLGANATGDGSNTGVFGNSNILTWRFVAGNVGIGITPTSKLHVNGTTTITGITALTSGTVSTNTTSGALVVTGGVGVSGAANIGGDLTASTAGIGGASVASAALTVTSTTKGILLPRMTKVQRDAISSPAAGLAVYQTDNTPGLRVYNGTNWMKYTEATD